MGHTSNSFQLAGQQYRYDKDNNSDDDDNSDDDEDDENKKEEKCMSLVEDAFVSSADSISNIKADIRVLHENNLVDHSLKEKAASLKASLIYEKDQSSNGLPLVYLKKDDEHNHTQFVELIIITNSQGPSAGPVVFARGPGHFCSWAQLFLLAGPVVYSGPPYSRLLCLITPSAV